MPRKLAAELLGTFLLVFGGCGSALLAAAFKPDTNLGIGLVGVALAFGGLIYRYVLDEDSPVNAANLPVAAAPVQSTSE